MLTIKLMKYDKRVDNAPDHTIGVCVREAKSVHVRYESDGRAVLQLGDAPGETVEVTIGGFSHEERMYDVAYIMNERGQTVETIR